MSEIATIADVIAEIRALRKEQELALSPWCAGDKAAAIFAGYKDKDAFVNWATSHGIKPQKDAKTNFWSKAEIRKAREKVSYA